jgi:hypothetical protein
LARRRQGVSVVAIGGTNPALWAVGAEGESQGKAFRHGGFFSGASQRLETLEGDWGRATGRFRSLAVGRVAPGEPVQVVGGEKVLGLDWDSSMPSKHDAYNNRWEQIGPKSSAISVGDDGTVVRLDDNGEFYRYDRGSTWTKLSRPGALRNISVVSKTNMWAVGTSGEVYSTM